MKYRINMSDTDAAGVLYFANQFNIMHLAYEEKLKGTDFSISKILKYRKAIIPIVHAEADFKTSLRIDDEIEITLSAEFKETSFTIDYLLKKNNAVAGKGKTVHVFIDANTHKTIEVPEAFKSIFT